MKKLVGGLYKVLISKITSSVGHFSVLHSSVFLFYGFPNLCRFLKRNAMDLECFDVNVFVSQTVDTEDIVIIKIKNRRQYE